MWKWRFHLFRLYWLVYWFVTILTGSSWILLLQKDHHQSSDLHCYTGTVLAYPGVWSIPCTSVQAAGLPRGLVNPLHICIGNCLLGREHPSPKTGLTSPPWAFTAVPVTPRIMPVTYLMLNDICLMQNTTYDDNSTRRVCFLSYNLLFICYNTFKTYYINEWIAISLRGGVF